MSKETITFVQNFQPALEDGLYQLTIAQNIVSTDNTINDSLFSVTKTLFVAGERFALKPGTLVSQFPGPQTRGDYDSILPHVVLKRKTFPWERMVNGSSLQPDALGNLPSWVAVLVFDASDPVPSITANTLADLVSTPSLVSYLASINDLEPNQQPTDPVQTIDLDPTLFATIAPSLADLYYLAHGRTKTTDGSDDYYSVVIGNRFPAGNSETTVMLVSLEGMESYLPNDTGISTLTSNIRLAVLASWKFYSIEEPHSFSWYFENMDQNTLALTNTIPDTPVTDAAAALSYGYVPYNHTFQQGSTSVSWYRGPFVPFAVSNQWSASFPYSDSALRYDPSTGMFDTSYAAAWELGRLMGLQSKAFSEALCQWKQSYTLTAGAINAANAINAQFPGIFTLQVPFSAEEILQQSMSYLKTAVSPNLQGMSSRSHKKKGNQVMLSSRSSTKKTTTLQAPPLPPLPEVIENFIQAAQTFTSIPFQYLVSNPELLPLESIRFFQVDPTWIASFLNGALAIGDVTGKDRTLTSQLLQSIITTNFAVESGVLIRSEVVKLWKDIEVIGHSAGHKKSILPFQKTFLSDTVLLVLFAPLVDTVVCRLPPEGIHFGFDTSTGMFSLFRNPTTGAQKNATPFTVPYRNQSMRVLRIHNTTSALSMVSNLNQALNTSLRSDDFAVEMIEGVPAVTFTLTTPNS